MRGSTILLLFLIFYNFISTTILLFIIMELRERLKDEIKMSDDFHNELVKKHKK